MSKGIELTSTQIKAYENGATMFLFPIDNKLNKKIDNIKTKNGIECFIELKSPIKKGDKDIFVQEEFFEIKNGGLKYKFKDYNEHPRFNKIELWQPASKMTEEQSRYSFSECIDVKICKIREILPEEFVKVKIVTQYEFGEQGFELIKYRMNVQLEEQNIDRTYEDNDYVILVEFKR